MAHEMVEGDLFVGSGNRDDVARRRLAYALHGDPGGQPVLLLHGSPGSRLFCPVDLPPKLRIITFDRPGYGGSDSHEGRCVLDCASDVAGLLDHLEIDTAGLIAWSGGCPFGVATAFGLGPKRITRLALVSGPGPLDEVPDAWEALGAKRRPAAEVARAGEPHRATRGIARTMAPFLETPTAFLGVGTGVDATILNDAEHREMLEAQICEALRPGPDGIGQDLIAMWMPFGFALQDVLVPTSVFHGGSDRNNGNDARTYAAKIPGAQLRIWPELGHLGMLERFGDVVAAVVGSRC